MPQADKDSLPSEAKSITSEDIVSEEAADGGYADPQTDIDPRTSKTGPTSVGATDLNADEAQDVQQNKEDAPGVRRGEG